MKLAAVLVMMALAFVSFGMDCAKHGEERKSKVNAWVSFVTLGISFALYWAAGLFDVFKRS